MTREVRGARSEGRRTTEPLRVVFAREALDAVLRHARQDLPDECCGLLVGTSERIERAVPARNLRRSPTRYLVDPEDHFAVLREVRATGRVVRGAYHSHPRGPDTPSPTDISESHDPSLLHVIVSLRDEQPGVRAYYLADGGYTAVDLADD